jgi:hypothetical protein
MPLFNTTHPSYAPHYLREQVRDIVTPANNTPTRPKVRSDFGPTPRASAIQSNQPAALTTYSLAGYFSTVRAALVINSLALGAFAAGGLPRYLASQLPTAADPAPAADAASTAFTNLRTMSYLPPQLAPTQQQFNSLNDSTKREALLTDLSDSINGSTRGLKQTVDNSVPNNRPLIPYVPSAPPWGGALCNQSQFGVTIKTNVVAMNPGTGTTLLAPTNVPGFVAQ